MKQKVKQIAKDTAEGLFVMIAMVLVLILFAIFAWIFWEYGCGRSTAMLWVVLKSIGTIILCALSPLILAGVGLAFGLLWLLLLVLVDWLEKR